MSTTDVQDGLKKTGNGDTEDTIPLKDADTAKDQSSSATIDMNDQSAGEKKNQSKFIGSYHEALRNLEITDKSKRTFLILVGLVILLAVVLVVLVALWPSIPSYMKYPACNTKHCLQSSLQIIAALDRNEAPCGEATYDWACGNFGREFQGHELHGSFRGEWSQKDVFKFEEISQVNSFITKSLTNVTGSGVFVKELYNSCMNLDKQEQSVSIPYIRKVIRNLGGWRMVEDGLSQWSQKKWTIQNALPVLHNRYGVSLFYKVHVIDRPSSPFGKIIAITEGDLGLPHKDLYLVDPSSKVVQHYKELLQNTLRLFDRSSEEARQFADVVFSYERRVVNDAFYINRGEIKGEIVRLEKLKIELSSIALYDTINAMFPKTKDSTEIWIEDFEKLRAIARVVSSTDATVLNDLTVWSTLMKLFPFASKDTRHLWDQYQHDIYGVHFNEPTWYTCTSTVNSIVPVAIEVLRHSTESHFAITENEFEYIETVFKAVRESLVKQINDVVWIDFDMSNFLVERLQKATLQVGVPADVVRDDSFLDRYYADFFPQIAFIENFEHLWEFEKSLLAKELGEFEESDEILFNLFPTSRSRKDDVTYSVELNKIIVRSGVVKSGYFNPKYPIYINFGRLGVDLARSLIQATQVLAHQYSDRVPSALPYGPQSQTHVLRCLQFESPLDITPLEAQRDLLLTLSATNVATAAFERLLSSIKNGKSTYFDSTLVDSQVPRLPGLQQYDAKELFDIVLLQKHCGLPQGGYSLVRPFFQERFPEEDTFRNIWRSLNVDDFGCSGIESLQCENVF